MGGVQSTYSVPTHHNVTGSRTNAVSMQCDTCKNLWVIMFNINVTLYVTASNNYPVEPVTQPTHTLSKSVIPEWLRNNQGTKLNMQIPMHIVCA